MTARLLAYARLFPSGALTWRGGEITRAPWPDYPALRAKTFFPAGYPKFGRMDPLCKLAVAVSQMIAPAFEGLDRDEIAQAGGTQLGCLEADAQFEQSRRAGHPSPALFVYTLPSMFQGEVAILHRLRGRCALLSAGALSGLTALATGVRWIEKGRAKHVLVIAADAAGEAAQKLDASTGPQMAAAAWLLSQDGEGIELSDVSFTCDDAAEVLVPGGLGYGLTFVDAFECKLLEQKSSRVAAQCGGMAVSLQVACASSA
jgi:hypothetical protein